MTELFGVSLDLIMWVLLGCLAVALLSVSLVALRNRVMFRIGVRNIPRRTAQTTLIVIGLMLSSLIISAAFTTGDTVARSLTSQVYNLLGSVDETIQVRGGLTDQEVDQEDAGSVQLDEGFALSQAATLVQQLRSDPNVDAVVPMYTQVAVAVNPAKQQSSPIFTVSGVDASALADLPDIKDAGSGKTLRLSDLAPGEMYVTKSGADELDVRAGDAIDISVFGKATRFRVAAVVEDKRLAGSSGISVRRSGGVLPIEEAQALFGAPDRITSIAVSNKGDVRGGVSRSDAVTAKARELADASGLQLSVIEAKKQGVSLSEQASSAFTTFFLVFGLFSIGAGVLLIFMIFVMLAAERKPEMGMARAVGIRRADLVQTFLSEGMGYNVASAAVGCLLGVGVAFVIAKVLASIFSNFDIDISPHVTARSLIVSYSLGVVLTFATVVFSSWRISNINIVRAIRDIPEPPMQRPKWGSRGFLGIVRDLVFQPADKRNWQKRGLIVATLAFALVGSAFAPLLFLAALLWLATLGLIAVRRTEFGTLTRAGVFLGLLAVSPLTLLVQLYLIFQPGPLLVLLGLAVIPAGASQESAFLLLFGLSLVPIGLALTARSFGANERLSYTLAGLALLYVWLFDFQFKLIQKVFGQTNGGVEMFFLSGLMITVASVFLAVYNSDLVIKVLIVAGSRLGSLMPSIRMAAAYPLVNKTRTGLTMAMFCLVVFALVVMSTMIFNFNHVFISDSALGGFDVTVDENPTNPLGDLSATLRAAGSSAPDSFEAVGATELANRSRVRVCEPRGQASRCNTADLNRFDRYVVRGDDPGFFQAANIGLQTRAEGYDSDAAVWDAVARDPSLAVVDAGALASGGGFGGGGGFIHSVDSGATAMQPVEIVVYDRTTRRTATFKVIGVIELGASNTYFGIHVSQAGFDQLFGQPDVRRFFIKTKAGTDNRALARGIEASLLQTGAQSDSLRHQVDQQSSLFTGFIRIIQGFMGLGLVVGVAAVGVIAFRTVVERRQQIGMLRALGYTRGMVGLTFLLESGFIALGGILTGTVFGLILTRYLIHEAFANQGVVDFVIPYTQVAVIGLLAFGSALLMTVLPSRQAAGIPIASALRYE